MRVCKPNDAGLIFGQGGPSMAGGFGEMSFAASSKPSSPAPSPPSFTPSVPSTMNPTFSGQPSQTDPSQGLPGALCGPSLAAGGSFLGGLLGGPPGSATGAFIGTLARETFCPAPAPAAPTTVSEVSLDTGTIGVDFGPDTQSAGTGLGDAEAVA